MSRQSELEALDTTQFTLFKDCLARKAISILTSEPSTSKRSKKDSTTLQSSDKDLTEDLDEFVTYLASEIFQSLSDELKTLTYASSAPSDASVSVPHAVSDSLVAYALVEDDSSCSQFVQKVLDEYIKEATAPLPAWRSTRTTECEICERQIPLTYHHLIPRSTHTKVLQRKWHPPEMLNSVAWLCRYCHSTVHSVASNEDLARYFHTVKLLLEREDIQRWRAYAARQRYGKRRG